MPTLMRKRFDQAALIQKRSEQQMKVAKKLGRRSVDVFKTGDMVVAQNVRTGKWTIRGKVTKARTMSRSFEIETETGKTTLRNSRHLRHQTKKMNVSFSAEVDSGIDDEASLQSDTSDLVTVPVRGPDRVSARLAALKLGRKRL